MDAYDRCTNLGKKILPIVLPSMVEAKNFSEHPRTRIFLAVVFETSKCSKFPHERLLVSRQSSGGSTFKFPPSDRLVIFRHFLQA